MEDDYCECENYYNSFNDVVNHFNKQYGLFLKTKSKDIKNNKSKYDKFESLYSSLKQMLESLPDKGNNYISLMKDCNKAHKSQIEEITSKLSKIEVLSQRIEEYHERIIKQIPEELEESEEEKEKEDGKKKKEEEDDELNYQEEELFANVDVNERMKNDQKNIKIIKDLLHCEELKAEREEEKRKLFKFQAQLDDLWKTIEVELNRNNEQIDDVEQKVENSLDVVVQANDQELEKAAKIAISRRRLAYQFGLGTALGAIGSVVPGIGNAIGIALGNLIGYGIYKIDNHRLNKAIKKQEKVRNERKNK